MCKFRMEKICLVLLVCFVFINTAQTVKEEYDVVVSFSQNVQSADGKTLLENMKATLQNTSEILGKAIGLQFTRVTFYIPYSWDTANWIMTVNDSKILGSTKIDFLIDNANDTVFGKFPFAQQYGSCGTPGHGIIIPTAFFSEANKFPKDITLAREWLKYRYGVFDENGYFDDPLYPLYYSIPGSDDNEVNINDCTNELVTYDFIDQFGNACLESGRALIDRLNSKECKIQPNKESLENVTSSFMYYQEDIKTMEHICSKNPKYQHNARSPNKHNALCRSQTVWDIVETHIQKEVGSGDIQYVYLREAKPKVVVAWENVAFMRNKSNIILGSIKRLIYDLPNRSKFDAFPFKRSLQTNRSYVLKELKDQQDKNNMVSSIYSDFVVDENGDINLTISKALEMLSKDSDDTKPEGTIIIITKSTGTLDETLLQRVQEKSKVCVLYLYFGEEDASEGLKKYVSRMPCRHLDTFSMTDSDEDTFKKLFAAMETALPIIQDDKITETAITTYLSGKSPINFEVDESIETVVFWIFKKKERENFELKLNGKRKYLSAMKTYDIMSLSYSPTEAGKITFSFLHDTEDILTQVRTTSKAGRYLRGNVLTYDTSEKLSSEQLPVIIYAIIRYGAYPVQDAKVTATIERPNSKSITLEMYDDGRGDPDITKNDGIYSRYFTQFSEKGNYKVTVSVKKGNSTSYGTDQNAVYQTCCGSSVKKGKSMVPEFSKEFKTIFTAKNGRPADGYKPSRILDFRVDNITDDKVVLKWSAPGDEGDTGKVQSYEIKHFNSEEAVKNFETGNDTLNNKITPKERGEDEIAEIKLSDFEETGIYYMAMRSKTLKQTSDISNVIRIFMSPSTTTTITTDVTSPTKDDDVKKAGTNKHIGLIIGLIIGFIILIILICLAVYFLVLKPRRNKEVQENSANHSTKREENNVLNPINFIPADTLLRNHNEKTRAKKENKDPPIFKEEDFEGRNSPPANESGDNNIQQPDDSNKTIENLPYKSPKRTTYV